MPSLRPLRAPERPADATLLATWRGETVHLWGWDGHQTMPLAWLDRARWAFAAHSGRFASFDIPLPDGRTIEAASIRLDSDATGPWLLSLTRADRSDPLAWLTAVARLADATVRGGYLTPMLRPERDALVARWLPVSAPMIDEALEALAASMPPILLPDPTDPTTVADIHATLVDSVARHRLAVGRWRPSVTGRTPAAAATRAVFRALSTGDPRVPTGPHDVAVGTIGTTLDRRRQPASGEPVVVPRLRLVVPEDLFDDWEVRLELVDELDPGRWCSADDVWDSTPMAVELSGSTDHLDALGSELVTTASAVAARIDTLEPFAAAHEPSSIELDLDAADRFLEQAPAELERLGIELVGPERLVRANLAVRGTVAGNPSEQRAGFNRDAVVDWRLVVADGDDSSAVSAAELARADAAGATLLHNGRRWVRIDPAALRKARQRLDEHTRQHGVVDAVTLLHLAAAGELDAPERGSAPPWSVELLEGLPDDRLIEAHEGERFAGALRPYQRRGLAWLRFLERLGLGGCLADDMGLGKTATALAHLQCRPGPHLVVCPLSVVHNWFSEAARFTPDLHVVVHHGADRDLGLDGLVPADVVVTTYGLLPRDLGQLSTVEWSTVVLDEAQQIKNPATRAARAVRTLRAGQKIALTGTPVENRLAELWAILDAVNPGVLGSREQFRHRYARPIERHGDAAAATRLRRITQPFVLRRSKSDRQLVPDLPDKIEQIAWAGLSSEQAVLYQHVVQQLLADAEQATGMRRRGLVLAALTRLKQICNHPAHALGDGSRLHGRSGKLARYDELVDELLDVGERALVFTQFREMGELLRRHAAERLELRVPFLHGGVTRNRRDAMVADFQAGLGPPLLLVSLRAGGTGLNLTAASQVIHYDRWWNPAVEDQATDRAWRIGQGRTVVVHKLVCEGTVEERIATVIDEKRALANTVVGGGEAWLSELSTAELRDLVTLDTSAVQS